MALGGAGLSAGRPPPCPLIIRRILGSLFYTAFLSPVTHKHTDARLSTHTPYRYTPMHTPHTPHTRTQSRQTQVHHPRHRHSVRPTSCANDRTGVRCRAPRNLGCRAGPEGVEESCPQVTDPQEALRGERGQTPESSIQPQASLIYHRRLPEVNTD